LRNAQQVIGQLLDFARSHDDIRAVVMNGSRTNPNAPQDFFCDYDVVYFVEDPQRYLGDQSWLASFGDLVILQQNDIDAYNEHGYIFLMLFTDGVRIDLFFNELINLRYVGDDTLTMVLMDKDGRIPTLPPSSDAGYHTQKPLPKEFAETLNEIFWCSNNMAKGIWRDELPYVKHMFDAIIRPCLLELLAWYAADLHGWAISTGKFGKWLKKFLPAGVWDAYVRTYVGASYAEMWDALFETLRLTREVGAPLAASLGYEYPAEDDRRTVAYLQHVRSLPPDAQSFDESAPQKAAPQKAGT
jgi:aminoglycoside 6-adenylyltransferase